MKSVAIDDSESSYSKEEETCMNICVEILKNIKNGLIKKKKNLITWDESLAFKYDSSAETKCQSMNSKTSSSRK